MDNKFKTGDKVRIKTDPDKIWTVMGNTLKSHPFLHGEDNSKEGYYTLHNSDENEMFRSEHANNLYLVPEA